MRNDTYLYTDGLDAARRSGQIALWRASHQANIACKKAIEDTARDYRPILLPYYSGGRLQHPGLFTEGRLFPNPAAAILRMEA